MGSIPQRISKTFTSVVMSVYSMTMNISMCPERIGTHRYAQSSGLLLEKINVELEVIKTEVFRLEMVTSVSPKRGAGAGMGVGILKGRRLPLIEKRDLKVSWFLLALLVPRFLCLSFLRFFISKFQSFEA